MGLEITEAAVGLKDFIPLINIALGVIIGGAISYLNTARLETRKQETESRRLALAFQGEIQALIGIIDRRKYLVTIQWFIDQMEKTDKRYNFHLHIRRNYFLVYQNNVSNIGLLPCSLPGLIAQFYVQASAVLEDIESLRDGTLDEVNLPDFISNMKTLHSLLKDTVLIGEKIIEKTESLYPSKKR